MLTLWHDNYSWVSSLMVSLSQFGLFGPRCLLNDADAKCACISVHIPLHHILLFVPIYHTSILSPFIVRVFLLCLPPTLPPFCSAAFLIRVSCYHHPHLHVFVQGVHVVAYYFVALLSFRAC